MIDEADTMFDQGFGEEVTKLLNILKQKHTPAQVHTVLLGSLPIMCVLTDMGYPLPGPNAESWWTRLNLCTAVP